MPVTRDLLNWLAPKGNKATSGTPALTPEKRDRQQTLERTREIQKESIMERITRARDDLKPDGGVQVTNLLAQMGRALPFPKFRQKLLRLNRNFHFERAHSDPTIMGLYILVPKTVIVSGEPAADKLFLMRVEPTAIPEFSCPMTEKKRIPHPSEAGKYVEIEEPVGYMRGWRAILIDLAKARLISLGEADRVFKITAGRSSEKWQKLIN